VLLCGVVTPQQQPSADVLPATVVAAELLRLQTELGGSIVQTAPLLKEPLLYDPLSRVPKSDAPACPLREAAWQLDLVARRLELAEQIEQADAIRGLSGQLRSDARATASKNRPSSGSK